MPQSIYVPCKTVIMDYFDTENAIIGVVRDKKFSIDELCTKKYGKEALREELKYPAFSVLNEILRDEWDLPEKDNQQTYNYRSVLFLTKKRATEFMESLKSKDVSEEHMKKFNEGMPCVLFEDAYDIDVADSRVTCFPCPPQIRKITKAFLKQIKQSSSSKSIQVSSNDTEHLYRCTQKTWDRDVAIPLTEYWRRELKVDCDDECVRVNIGRQYNMVKTQREFFIPEKLKEMEYVIDQDHFLNKFL